MSGLAGWSRVGILKNTVTHYVRTDRLEHSRNTKEYWHADVKTEKVDPNRKTAEYRPILMVRLAE